MTQDSRSLEEALHALAPVSAFFPAGGAKKNLGQHFLHDLNLTRQIASIASPLNQGSIIEIGPGTGGLTRALLLEGASSLYAIERDPDCLKALAPLVKISGKRLTLINADARHYDITQLGETPRQIIANLPYQIGTNLLRGWLEKAEHFSAMTLMFQKEVAERLTARPHSKAYGYISVLAQYHFDCHIMMTLPASTFTPPPKVASAVIAMRSKAESSCDYTLLERICAEAFSKRRKILRHSLAGLKSIKAEHLCEEAAIDPGLRAEALTVDDFVALARAFEKHNA